jgi:ATP-dependent DNA ligase
MLLQPRALPAGFIAPCLPSSAPQAPSGKEWLHEIKHDGFRVWPQLCGNSSIETVVKMFIISIIMGAEAG